MRASNLTQEVEKHRVCITNYNSEIANILKGVKLKEQTGGLRLKEVCYQWLRIRTHSKPLFVVIMTDFVLRIEDIILQDPNKYMRAFVERINMI